MAFGEIINGIAVADDFVRRALKKPRPDGVAWPKMDDPDPDIFPDELGGRDFVSKRILPLQIEPKVGNLDKNTRRRSRGALLNTAPLHMGATELQNNWK